MEKEIMQVVSIESGEVISIKASRFNPEIHEEIKEKKEKEDKKEVEEKEEKPKKSSKK